MNKKNYFWYNFRGILILLIVFGQFLYTYSLELNGSVADVIYTCINTFCIPAFVFSFGYLSKSERARGKTELTVLLLYYILFNTVMLLLLYFFKDKAIRLLYPSSFCWFVLSLIFWKKVVEPLSKIKGIIPISAVAALLVGFCGDFSNLLAIRRTVAYFIFFLLGYKFDPESFKKMIRSRSAKKYLIALAVTCVGVAALILIVKNFNITHTMMQMGAYKQPLHLVYRLFIMGVSVCAIVSLLMLTPTANISVLTTLGRNSLLIFLSQAFVVELFERLFRFNNYSEKYILYAAFATLITCILFGDNRLNKFADGIARRTALHIVNGDTVGKRLQTAILIGLLVLMAAVPILKAL
ncbi:MAG: hypothetical protein IKK29_00395 [Christensenellaceae bacterium]|nr:hypothetical protein [Christensenellaceae bacterium]